jgi:hypothetical protein
MARFLEAVERDCLGIEPTYETRLYPDALDAAERAYVSALRHIRVAPAGKPLGLGVLTSSALARERECVATESMQMHDRYGPVVADAARIAKEKAEAEAAAAQQAEAAADTSDASPAVDAGQREGVSDVTSSEASVSISDDAMGSTASEAPELEAEANADDEDDADEDAAADEGDDDTEMVEETADAEAEEAEEEEEESGDGTAVGDVSAATGSSGRDAAGAGAGSNASRQSAADMEEAEDGDGDFAADDEDDEDLRAAIAQSLIEM